MTIHGSVVTDSGVVSAKDVAINHGTAGAGLPSAAFQGTDYAVGWTDARDGGSLYGTRVSLTGTRSSADSKLAADAPRVVGFRSDHTNFAFNGSHLFFTYLGGEPNGVEGSLLTPTLAVAKGAIPLTAIPNSQAYPYTSFDGTDYVVAWNDEDSSKPDADLHAVRINGAGQVLDPQGVAVSPTDGLRSASRWRLLGTARRSSSGPAPTTCRSSAAWRSTDAGHRRTVRHATRRRRPRPGQRRPRLPERLRRGRQLRHRVRLRSLAGSRRQVGRRVPHRREHAQHGPFVLPAPSGYLVAYARSGSHLVAVSDTGALGQVLDLASTAAVVNGASSQTSSLVAWSDHTGRRGRFRPASSKPALSAAKASSSRPTASVTPRPLPGTAPPTGRRGSPPRTRSRVAPSARTERSAPSSRWCRPKLCAGAAQRRKRSAPLELRKARGGGRSYRIASRLLGRGAGGSGGISGGERWQRGSRRRWQRGWRCRRRSQSRAQVARTAAPGPAAPAGPPARAGPARRAPAARASPARAGATGGTPATGGTTGPGSGGSSASGGAAAGSSGTGGSGGSGCSVAPSGPGDRCSALGALFGLAWAFTARRRRAGSLTAGKPATPSGTSWVVTSLRSRAGCRRCRRGSHPVVWLDRRPHRRWRGAHPSSGRPIRPKEAIPMLIDTSIPSGQRRRIELRKRSAKAHPSAALVWARMATNSSPP